MTIHDILFPERLSYGTKGGPSFRTVIMPSDSGHEVRSTEWDPRNSRLTFDVAKSIQSEDEIAELLNLYMVCRGSGKGFLFKDFSDWTAHPNGRSMPNISDPTHRHPTDPPQTSGESNRIFQIQKRYTDDAGNNHFRKITRPIKPRYTADHLLAVFVGGVPLYYNGAQVSPFATSIDWDTGRIHIGGGTLPAGLEVDCLFNFHVPCRFGADFDERFDVRWDEADLSSFDSVPIVEITGDRSSPYGGELLFGGSSEIFLSTTPPHTILPTDGFFQRYTGGPAFGGALWTPSEPLEIASGGPYFLLENQSAGGLTVVGNGGSPVLGSLAVGQTAELWKVAIGASIPGADWILR